MDFTRNIDGFLFCFFLFLSSFFGTIFFLFPLLIIILRFNVKIFHKIVDFFFHSWLSYAAVSIFFLLLNYLSKDIFFYLIFKFLIENLLKINIQVYLKNNCAINKYNDKSVIIMMNHRTRMDWLFFFCVLSRLKGLDNIKIILKRSLRSVPGPGWKKFPLMSSPSYFFLF
jgi:lysocardiolipin and lysophospholipid acyltransferase